VPEGLPALHVEALDSGSARDLLLERAHATVASDVATRLVTETAGLPLAIIEVALALTEDQLTGRASLPDELPFGSRLELHFRAQAEALGADARLLLLVAAAEPTGDPAPVRAAAAALGVAPFADEDVMRSGLLALDQGVSFRHPLVRSAVYASAAPFDRRRAHQALADAIDAHVHPDLRAWHRAAATVGPDENVASELSASADAARVRGGYAEEAAFRTLAAELTPEPSARGRRLLAAAQAHLAGGAPQAVGKLLEEAEPLLDAPVDIAEAQRLIASIDALNTPGSVAARLLAAARIVEPSDAAAARVIYGQAVGAAVISFQLTAGTTPAEVAAAALRNAGVNAAAGGPENQLVDGIARRLAVGYEDAFPVLRRAFDELEADVDAAAALHRVAVIFNYAGSELWDEAGGYRLLRELERRDRAAGALGTLRLRLEGLGHHEMWRGNFGEAAACHAEVVDISVAMGGDPAAWRLNAVELYAWQGDESRARELAALMLSDVMETVGAGVMANVARMGMVVLDLAHGRYRDAFDGAWYLFGIDPPGQGNQVLPDVVEAAVRCGETARGEAALERLTARAGLAATPWALGVLARARAMLAADDDAEAQYEAALALLGQSEVATERARTHLLYGEWLRRRRRRSDARHHLRQAQEMFDTMGARAFALRAAIELAATGEHARRRAVDTTNDLTPQESRIARLAATGATNREIAAQLFISAATVEHHLRQVFRKLGVTSRRQLARDRERLLLPAPE